MVTRIMLPMLTLRITMRSSLDIDCNVSSIIKKDLTLLYHSCIRWTILLDFSLIWLTYYLYVAAGQPSQLISCNICANVCKIVSPNNRLDRLMNCPARPYITAFPTLMKDRRRKSGCSNIIWKWFKCIIIIKLQIWIFWMREVMDIPDLLSACCCRVFC